MAQLQLAMCSYKDPIVSSPNLSVTSQEKCYSEVLGDQPRLEHPRIIQQQLLSNKDKKMKDVCIQESWRSSYSHPAASSQLISENAGFWSTDPHNWYLKNQVSTLPFHWRAKRRQGIDRAYPLKPVFHQKAGYSFNPSTWQVGTPPTTEASSPNISSEIPSPNISSGSKRSHAVKAQHVGVPSPSVEQSKTAASHPRRAESGYIKKLEAASRNLEEEIQRKEALLREKLRRTEKELLRIQWEKQQAQAKTKNQQRLWKPTDISWGHLFRPTAQPYDGQRKTVLTSPVVSVETTSVLSELHMERLKKQQLVASNSNQENVSQKNTMTPCPELASRHDQPPTVVLLRQTESMATPYTESPSSVEDCDKCSFCGRKFYSFRLEKHISICRKNHSSKRKVFDSSKARAKGTELEAYNLLMGSGTSWKQTSTKSTDMSTQSSMQPKQSNWKQKHKSFIETLRRAREMQQIISKGGKASDLPPVPPMENPDYKMCPYCTRLFAPQVAERHIPKCKNIKNRPPPPQQKRHC